MKRVVLFLAMMAFASVSCTKQTGEDIADVMRRRGKIVEITHGGTVSIPEIMDGMGEDGKTDSLRYDSKLKYEVDFYIIKYETQSGLAGSVFGRKIVPARSLLLVPKGISKENARYAAYFHGTVMPAKKLNDLFAMGTPADFTGHNGSQDVRHVALPLASAGYCVICPEYTGYGPTANIDHPFIYYPELAISAYDAITSGYLALTGYGLDKSIDPGIHIDPGKKLWICGWSQGGGLALYMQKQMENNPEYRGQEFEVMATSTLAGPFNVKRFMMEVIEKPDKPQLLMALYGWAAYAVNYFSPDLQRPMDQVFRPSIYSQSDAILQFGNTPRDLFQGFFISHILDGTDPVFLKVLDDDSTYEGWNPKAPVFLHHGKEDSIVPSFNSVDAHEGLDKRSANGVKLFLYTGNGSDGKALGHANFVPVYTAKTIEEFNSIQ